jgi:hypothetical protein
MLEIGSGTPPLQKPVNLWKLYMYNSIYFRAPQGGNLTNSIIQKHTKTLAAVAPAKAGSIGSTVSVAWKEETVVFVRDRVRVEQFIFSISVLMV